MDRLQAHEAFEMATLQWLRAKSLLRPLALGGGTMLRLCHELPRYSLDMVCLPGREPDFREMGILKRGGSCDHIQVFWRHLQTKWGSGHEVSVGIQVHGAHGLYVHGSGSMQRDFLFVYVSSLVN